VKSLVLRLGIVGVLAVVGFFVQQYVSKAAGDLKVGDCFDPPSAAVETVEDVKPHPCSDPHGAEVFFVGNLVDAQTVPSDADIETWVSDNCFSAYTAYTGLDMLATEEMDLGYFSPTADGWSKGDHTVLCYAAKHDETNMTGSLKKT